MPALPLKLNTYCINLKILRNLTVTVVNKTYRLGLNTGKEVNYMEKFKSGETVPVSSYYKAYDNTGHSRDGETTYLEKGTRFPPLQHEGGYWVKSN